MILTIGTTPAIARTMIFEDVKINDVNRAKSVLVSAAGKAVNVARVLRTLDEEVTCLGFAGGETGGILRRELAAMGVVDEMIEVDAPTRVCVTVVDKSKMGSTELIEEASPAGENAWKSIYSRINALVPKCKFVVMSGTIAPDGPVDFYARVCRAAAGYSVPTLVDATGDALLATLEHHPTIIKPNFSELLATLGGKKSPIDLSRELCQRGAQWCVVTGGADRILVRDKRSVWNITPPKVRVTSTIGSGDAFAAGLASGIVRGMTVSEAAVFATACGSANAETPQAGFVQKPRVEELQKYVRIQQLI